MKVLLAEDEKRMNRALCEIMRQEGYEVTSVDNGEDALYEIESNIYDLCVLDVMMPGLSGYDVAKKARASGIRTPILMLTAKSELAEKELRILEYFIANQRQVLTREQITLKILGV